MNIDATYVEATLGRLVQINSINPSFSDGSTNEREIAAWLITELERMGVHAEQHDAAPGRPSVLGRLRGATSDRSILLYGHIDTVGIEGMADPFSGATRDGRLYGRGAYDMKCGVAACLSALHALTTSGTGLDGDVFFAGVADEEVASIGVQQILSICRPDAAIVTEPTHLRLVIAHKGFTWLEIETRGTAAHGSRFTDGRDANAMMARLLSRVDDLARSLVERTPHALVGPPSMHIGLLQGGTGLSTYAAHCRAGIERRTVPGETEAQVVAELRDIIAAISAQDALFDAGVRVTLNREAFEARADSRVRECVARAAVAAGLRPPDEIGESYWMDAAFFAAAGVDTIVFGATGAGAHADVEWADIASVVTLADVLARSCVDYLGGAGDSIAATV